MLDMEVDDVQDLGLLDLALIALTAAGFRAQMTKVGEIPAVHAESQLMAILVGSATTVDGLLAIEPILSSEVVSLLGVRKIPDRRRDGYVVLLTSQRAETRQGEALFGITYNLRHARRIVRVGVEPTTAGVTRALRPVLPLIARAGDQHAMDPIEDLSRRLLKDGLDEAYVRDALRRFRNFASVESIASGDAGVNDD